jgi:hypothetical protein
MSCPTLEVEIEQGKITPGEPARLPQKGKGLLTVLETEPESAEASGIQKMTQVEALEALQKHLTLEDKRVVEWMTIVRDARR